MCILSDSYIVQVFIWFDPRTQAQPLSSCLEHGSFCSNAGCNWTCILCRMPTYVLSLSNRPYAIRCWLACILQRGWLPDHYKSITMRFRVCGNAKQIKLWGCAFCIGRVAGGHQPSSVWIVSFAAWWLPQFCGAIHMYSLLYTRTTINNNVALFFSHLAGCLNIWLVMIVWRVSFAKSRLSLACAPRPNEYALFARLNFTRERV